MVEMLRHELICVFQWDRHLGYRKKSLQIELVMVVVAQAFNSSTPEAEANLIYTVSSRTAKAT